MPDDSKKVTIACNPQKGNLSNCDSLRGDTLLSTPGEMHYQMILNHTNAVVDAQLCEEQVGFRLKQSHTDQIFTLRCIIEKYHDYQVPLLFSFINSRRAFDSIHRLTLWRILASYRVLARLVSAIEDIYDKLSCCV